MRRVPLVTNLSAKFSGLRQASLLQTIQPSGERLHPKTRLFTARFAAMPKRNRDSLHERYATSVWGTNITGWTAGADIAFRF